MEPLAVEGMETVEVWGASSCRRCGVEPLVRYKGWRVCGVEPLGLECAVGWSGASCCRPCGGCRVEPLVVEGMETVEVWGASSCRRCGVEPLVRYKGWRVCGVEPLGLECAVGWSGASCCRPCGG